MNKAHEKETAAGNYVSIHGLNMYYEIHGAPQSKDQVPLVLLHGSLSATGTSFGQVLPGLAQTRQIIAIEQQAHGHTADIDRPLTLEQMAADTLALLHQISIQKADFFGYSMGTGIAMNIAVQHPEMVRKLVLAGGVNYNREGYYPGLLEGIANLKPEYLVGSPFYDEYMQIAPRPEDFPRLVEKTKGLDQSLRDWSPEEIRSIQAPTLLIIGDSDIVRPEHVAEMFRLLGGGVPGDNVGLPRARLAVLPGTTHVTLVQRGDWLVSMVTEFLDAHVT
jgi:pimeloyl-ACP methyl ester carboxylesterase